MLADEAFVYVPKQCQDDNNDRKGKKKCVLHVVFHGCLQTTDNIGLQYVEETGYNEVAETNNLVILYPQAIPDALKNPNGCWDWWGYTNKKYAHQKGKQVKTVWRMIEKLQDNDAKLERVYPEEVSKKVVKEEDENPSSTP